MPSPRSRFGLCAMPTPKPPTLWLRCSKSSSFSLASRPVSGDRRDEHAGPSRRVVEVVVIDRAMRRGGREVVGGQVRRTVHRIPLVAVQAPLIDRERIGDAALELHDIFERRRNAHGDRDRGDVIGPIRHDRDAELRRVGRHQIRALLRVVEPVRDRRARRCRDRHVETDVVVHELAELELHLRIVGDERNFVAPRQRREAGVATRVVDRSEELVLARRRRHLRIAIRRRRRRGRERIVVERLRPVRATAGGDERDEKEMAHEPILVRLAECVDEGSFAKR